MNISNSFPRRSDLNKETLNMLDLNLPTSNVLTPHLRRARRERANVTADILRTGIAAIRKGIASLAAARARQRLRRETVRQLNTLPDRALHDIGLSRSQIWTVADDLVNGAARNRAPDPAPHHRAAANRNRVDSSPQLITPAAACCG